MADETQTAADSGGGHDDFDLPLSDSNVNGPGADSGTAAPATTAAGTEPPAPSQEPDFGGLPRDLYQAMREENLRVVQGETPEQAYARMNLHLGRKYGNYRKDLAKERDRHTNEIAALRESLRPILAEAYNRQRQEQLELQAAQIPEKGTPEYQEWLLEEGLRRDEARRQEEWDRAQAAERSQAEQAALGQLRELDASGYDKVAQGLGLVQGAEPDPVFRQAYELFSDMAFDAAQQYFPDGAPEQIHQFVALSQQVDVRRAEQNGVDIRDVMKERLDRMVDGLVRQGIVQRVTAGSGAPAAGVPAPAPVAPAPSTAQRVAQSAQAAQRRGPVAVPGSARPTNLPGQMPDMNAFEDAEDYVEAVLAGLLPGELERAAPHRKQR